MEITKIWVVCEKITSDKSGIEKFFFLFDHLDL